MDSVIRAARQRKNGRRAACSSSSSDRFEISRQLVGIDSRIRDATPTDLDAAFLLINLDDFRHPPLKEISSPRRRIFLIITVIAERTLEDHSYSENRTVASVREGNIFYDSVRRIPSVFRSRKHSPVLFSNIEIVSKVTRFK